MKVGGEEAERSDARLDLELLDELHKHPLALKIGVKNFRWVKLADIYLNIKDSVSFIFYEVLNTLLKLKFLTIRSTIFLQLFFCIHQA